MHYGAYQILADVGDAARAMAAAAQRMLAPWSDFPYAAPLQRVGCIQRGDRARRLHPQASGLRHRRSRDPRRKARGERTGRPPHALLRPVALHQGRRGGRSKSAARRADVRPFRDVAARHVAHASARPSGLHHRLAQSPRHRRRAWTVRPRGIHSAYHRFHQPHRRRVPRRRGLPAVRLRARRDRDHGGASP